jgi:penicillin amidase
MYDGKLIYKNLSAPVEIKRDVSGVVHISANTDRDAAFALGFSHAQDRSWQLEFNRRVLRGELSEILGVATLPTDKLMRTLGLMQAAQQQLDRLPADVRDQLTAYSEGVNAFHANRPQGLPPEFLILRTQPGGRSGVAWQPVDSVAMTLLMALDLGGNWGNEFARLAAARTLSTAQLWDLYPAYPGEKPATAVDLAKLYRELGVYKTEGGLKTSMSLPVIGEPGFHPNRQTTARQRPAFGIERTRHLVLRPFANAQHRCHRCELAWFAFGGVGPQQTSGMGLYQHRARCARFVS